MHTLVCSAHWLTLEWASYSQLMIRNVWHISGGEGWCANTTCKRLLVTHTDGSQTVEEVKDDFDVDLKDIEGLKKILTEQGVEVSAGGWE